MRPESEFAWRRTEKGQRDNYCRHCRAAYKQIHYRANKGRYVASAAARRRELLARNLERLLEYLTSHPCVDCGLADPLVLEFDHLRDKKFPISRGLRERAWESVREEIEKCEVVCANCHRRRTLRRGGFARLAGVVQRQNLTLPRS